MSVAINSNYYAGYTMNSANKFKNVSDYSKYLTNKYKCLTPCKNASVLTNRTKKDILYFGGAAVPPDAGVLRSW